VRINSYALVEDAILFDGVVVGRGARVRRAIIDKDVRVPAGFVIGWTRRRPRAGYTITDDGITVVAKGKTWNGSDEASHKPMSHVWTAAQACGPKGSTADRGRPWSSGRRPFVA